MSKPEDGESPTPVWGTVNYVERAYSLPRFTIYQGINDGSLESRVVGAKAKKRGRRLILLESVDALIARSPSKTSPKVRREMSKLGKAAAVARHVAKLKRRRVNRASKGGAQ
jgi:hypothetical protein